MQNEIPEITVEMVEQELLRLAEKHPNAFYQTVNGQCSYTIGTAGGGEGCIFGQALLACGVPKHVLEPFDEQFIVPSILSLWFDLTGDKCPRSWTEVQESQDDGAPWGVAVEALLDADY